MAISYGNSWVEIANRALGRLGKGRIDDLTTGGELAQYCNLFLGEAIEETLGQREWLGYRSRVQLARSATTPVYGYDYLYPLPVDLVTIVEVNTDEMEYSVEGSDVLTDADEVYLTYVPRPTTPAVLPGYLKKAISTRLAALLTTPLKCSDALRNTLLQEAVLADDQAVRSDASRSMPAEEPGFNDEAR